MLRLTREQPDFWDQILPEEARHISPELQVVDSVLDDEAFLAPFRPRFPSKRGRYTIPMDTYLRLMFLKMKYGLGYESLVAEVNDSVSWRRFCRISLSARVPDASTLIKLTNGPCQGLAEEVHDALVKKLGSKKVLRARKLRVDTTVVEADIHYPTDADLLADGVRVVTRAIGQVQQAGVAKGMPFRNAGRAIGKRLLGLAKGLKQEDGKKQATRASVTAEVLAITEQVLRRAKLVRERIKQELDELGNRLCPGIQRRVDQLDIWLGRTQRVVEQTKQVLSGNPHIKNRLVSLFDPDARPIRKGKLNVAGGTEFGYKVVIADEDRGFVTDYQVTSGNPEDGTLLVASVERHSKRVGRVPKEVAVDRGMASAGNDRALARLGVVHRSLPKTGQKNAVEHAKERSAWFRRLQRFRAGGEARISVLKRKYGWRRSRLRGLEGVKTWVGWGVITHNLVKYARFEMAATA
ncbi:MAG: ISNCY family transposase [Chloroflexota bacterium]|nr:ISNCY family transposase [Chloroflexota bacterium]